jgi:cyclic pyranopterin phosphate synthase
VRASADGSLLHTTIDEAISRKPRGHDFVFDLRGNAPAVSRYMSVTGG